MSTLECVVCADPNRYTIEQAYLEDGSGRGLAYTRQQIERHMSHIADPRALALVTDLANASAVAGRLRALETMAVRIMDAALEVGPQGQPPDGKLALQALREARSTLVEMGRLTATLESQHEEIEERPDIDAMLASYLSGQQVPPPTDEAPPEEPTFLRELTAG